MKRMIQLIHNIIKDLIGIIKVKLRPTREDKLVIINQNQPKNQKRKEEVLNHKLELPKKDIKKRKKKNIERKNPINPLNHPLVRSEIPHLSTLTLPNNIKIKIGFKNTLGLKSLFKKEAIKILNRKSVVMFKQVNPILIHNMVYNVIPVLVPPLLIGCMLWYQLDVSTVDNTSMILDQCSEKIQLMSDIQSGRVDIFFDTPSGSPSQISDVLISKNHDERLELMLIEDSSGKRSSIADVLRSINKRNEHYHFRKKTSNDHPTSYLPIPTGESKLNIAIWVASIVFAVCLTTTQWRD